MKIMKYTLWATVGLSLLFASCESILDINPKDRLTTKDYFTNEEQLQLYSNQFYSNNFPGDGDIYKDNADVLIVSPLDDEVSGQRVIPETGGGWSWSALRSINFLLDNLGNCKDQKVRDKYEALARFFRAYFYFEKVKRFGDVPWYDKVLGSDDADLYKARDSREFVMGKIMEDLNFAIEVFKETNRTKELYRVTWWTAQALKSRVGLFEGTYRKYHGLGDYENFLQEAVKASEALMAMKKYEIYNTGNPDRDYATLFTSDDLTDNKEVILFRKYVAGLLGHRLCGYLVASGNGATKDFVDDFLCIEPDGSAKPVALSETFNDDEYENVLDNRDPRLTQIVLDPRHSKEILYNKDKFIFPRVAGMTGWESATGYHVIKYYIAEQDMKGYGNETHDAPLLRYAEVLLNLAEAKAELGTITQSDLDRTVNVIRDRAGMPHLTLNPVMDPKYAAEGLSSLIIEIRRERRVELCFEDTRYQDLMRWKWGKRLANRVLGMRFEPSDFDNPRFNPSEGKADPERVKLFELNGKHYIDVFAGTDWENRSFDENKHYYHPIPVNVIGKNKEITQNPGWD